MTQRYFGGSLIPGWLTPELHGGTVTFLFTDIEGSTRLLKQMGGGYGEVLAEHQRILRAAFAAHGGREVDTQGDSFFVAFRTAKDAVAAAVDAQRDLEAQGWPEGAQIRVRMGLHTGEPRVGGERYVGIGVHRAARIGAAGHGGQVLLSSTTKELAEEDLPPGVSIRDLGERRLKDLDQRQRLYQLVIEGLPSEFRPLRTLDVELKRKRRRLYAGSALIGAAAAAVAIPIFALGQGSSGGSGVKVAPNSVAVIDPKTNRVIDDVTVGTRPGSIVRGFRAVWVANLDDETVSRIDAKARRQVRAIPLDVSPTGLAAGAGKIWFASVGPLSYGGGTSYAKIRLGRIDPAFNSLAGTSELRNKATWGAVGPLVAGRRSVWVTSGHSVIRVDAATGREALTQVGFGVAWGGLNGIALGAGATWVSDGVNKVSRIEPTGVLTEKVPVGNGPSALAVGDGAVWVADTADDEVKRIDAGTNAVETTVTVGRNPTGIAVGAGAVWVANSGDGTVTRIDPQTNTPTRIPVGGSPTGILFADGLVWVSVQEVAAAGGRQGGTARVDVEGINHTDPAVAGFGFGPELQVFYATCAQLVGYPDRAGPAGWQLVPDVARSLPRLSADRRTYTFTVRKGFRFSPPSTETVTAATFKYSIERSLDPRTSGTAPFYLGDIVGVKVFEAGRASHIAGIRARGDTLSIRLTGVSGSFLSRLAMPLSCAVPTNTPVAPNGLPAIPSAGPYYIASYQPHRSLVLRRNPNYRGPRPRRLGEFHFALNPGAAQALKQAQAGLADYAAWQSVTRTEGARLAARYGAASPLGRAGRQQYFVTPLQGVWDYALNTARPLFASARVRRAVNFALDRRALVHAAQGVLLATDQYVPPGITGFRDAHIYPLEGDLGRARRLAGSRRRSAVFYTCDLPGCLKKGHVLARNLAAIGIHLKIHTFSFDALGKKLARKGEPWDIADAGWFTDGFFDPFDFLNPLFDGNLPVNGNNANTQNADVGRFDDPTYNKRLEAAAKLSGAARYRTYARLDADLARNAAPVLAYANGTSEDFFSARMGCQVYGVYGIDLGALCIRGRAAVAGH